MEDKDACAAGEVWGKREHMAGAREWVSTQENIREGVLVKSHPIPAPWAVWRV